MNKTTITLKDIEEKKEYLFLYHSLKAELIFNEKRRHAGMRIFFRGMTNCFFLKAGEPKFSNEMSEHNCQLTIYMLRFFVNATIGDTS